MRRYRAAVILLAAMMLAAQSLTLCQTKPSSPAPKPTSPQAARTKARRVMLSIGGGFGRPLTHDGIKQFWTGGPVGSIGMLFAIDPSFAAGIGFEGALLPFNEKAFEQTYPNVPVHSQDVALMHLFIQAKYTPFGKYRLAPYIAGTLGGAKLSNAEYVEVIGGRRVTYYNIHGITRVAAGLALGSDLMISRSVFLWAELKATYIHNDPNIGLWSSLVGGARFVL